MSKLSSPVISGQRESKVVPSFNDRIAQTKQGIMERIGVRENEIEDTSVLENYKEIFFFKLATYPF